MGSDSFLRSEAVRFASHPDCIASEEVLLRAAQILDPGERFPVIRLFKARSDKQDLGIRSTATRYGIIDSTNQKVGNTILRGTGPSNDREVSLSELYDRYLDQGYGRSLYGLFVLESYAWGYRLMNDQDSGVTVDAKLAWERLAGLGLASVIAPFHEQRSNKTYFGKYQVTPPNLRYTTTHE